MFIQETGLRDSNSIMQHILMEQLVAPDTTVGARNIMVIKHGIALKLRFLTSKHP